MIVFLALITICIGCTSYIGDTLLFKIDRIVLKALVDNSAHGLIGLLSWSIVLLLVPRPTIFTISNAELALSYFIASAVDIDHFIWARSFSIEASTSLGDQRPPFHCTTLALSLVSLILFLGKINESFTQIRLAWMIFVCVGSHHLRDAIRRGLWFCPFGSTKPIPYPFYMVVLMSLPYITLTLLKFSNEFIHPFTDVTTKSVALTV